MTATLSTAAATLLTHIERRKPMHMRENRMRDGRLPEARRRKKEGGRRGSASPTERAVGRAMGGGRARGEVVTLARPPLLPHGGTSLRPRCPLQRQC